MKNLKTFSLGIAMLITFLTFGQTTNTVNQTKQKTITGIVSDIAGPLPGATITVKGTTRGSQTNFDGKYSLQASEGETLVFSYIGYQSISVIIAKLNVIDVILKENANTLNEVVLSGQHLYKGVPSDNVKTIEDKKMYTADDSQKTSLSQPSRQFEAKSSKCLSITMPKTRRHDRLVVVEADSIGLSQPQPMQQK